MRLESLVAFCLIGLSAANAIAVPDSDVGAPDANELWKRRGGGGGGGRGGGGGGSSGGRGGTLGSSHPRSIFFSSSKIICLPLSLQAPAEAVAAEDAVAVEALRKFDVSPDAITGANSFQTVRQVSQALPAPARPGLSVVAGTTQVAYLLPTRLEGRHPVPVSRRLSS